MPARIESSRIGEREGADADRVGAARRGGAEIVGRIDELREVPRMTADPRQHVVEAAEAELVEPVTAAPDDPAPDARAQRAQTAIPSGLVAPRTAESLQEAVVALGADGGLPKAAELADGGALTFEERTGGGARRVDDRGIEPVRGEVGAGILASQDDVIHVDVVERFAGAGGAGGPIRLVDPVQRGVELAAGRMSRGFAIGVAPGAAAGHDVALSLQTTRRGPA